MQERGVQGLPLGGVGSPPAAPAVPATSAGHGAGRGKCRDWMGLAPGSEDKIRLSFLDTIYLKFHRSCKELQSLPDLPGDYEYISLH